MPQPLGVFFVSRGVCRDFLFAVIEIFAAILFRGRIGGEIDRGFRTLSGRFHRLAYDVEDDFVVVNYKGTIDDKPITDTVKVARGLSEQSNAWLHLKRNPLVPGLVEALIGGNKGDKKTVPVKFPEEFIYEELVGKEGQFEVEIVDIKEQSLPELDDTFAKSFGAEGIDKLTEGVEADLKNELEYSEKQSIRNQCVQKLLEKVTCDLPETIVNQATRAVVHNIVPVSYTHLTLPTILLV